MVRRASEKREEDGDRAVCLRLSRTQVNEVVRAAGPTSGILRLLQDLGAERQLPVAEEPMMSDPRLSRSVLAGLLVLACFTTKRTERKVNDVARQLGMPPSTTHRFIKTLQVAGLLEQNPDTRAYRLVRK
jgi:DNA-binding MarR family transcriptional regulator